MIRLSTLTQKCKWHKAIISATFLQIYGSVLKDQLSLETYVMRDVAVYFYRYLADMQVTWNYNFFQMSAHLRFHFEG